MLDRGNIELRYELLDQFKNVAGNALTVIKARNWESRVFHYNGGGAVADANRVAATAGSDNLKTNAEDPLDEYPFSSTYEGGKGARVVAAPME